MRTFAEFNRTDGPADRVAHGYLVDAAVAIAADMAGDEPAFQAHGLMLSLLGTADAATLRRGFAGLAEEGKVLEDPQEWP